MFILRILGKAVKESISPRLWAFFLVIFAIFMVVSLIVQALTVDLAFNVLFSKISGNPLTALQQIAFNLGTIIAIGGGALIVYTIIITFVSIVFQGIQFNGARMFLSGTRGISTLIRDAWKATKPRMMPAFFLSILLSILSLILLAIFLTPLIGSLLPLFSGKIPDKIPDIPSFLGLLIIEMVLFVVLMILLAPVLSLLYPIVFFEKTGVLATIRKAISLGAKKYLRNLAYLLFFWATLIAAMLVLLAVFFLAIISFAFPPIGWLVGLLLMIIAFIYFICLLFWMISFGTIAIIRYYEMAQPQETAPQVPKIKFPSPRKK